MRKSPYIVFSIFLLVSNPLMAQSRSSPRVSTVVAVLEKSLDSKTATIGQEIILLTLTEVVVGGVTIIPKGSKLVGQTADAGAKGNEDRKSVLAIRIEKAITNKGTEIPLQAIIAALKAPADDSLASDPHYGMMHSNEPKMIGSGPGSAAGTGNLPASSKASSTAAVATAQVKGGMDSSPQLTEDSQGAIGYDGTSISWSLDVPPPTTIIISKARNLKLKAGTQVLLRMAEPHVAR